MSGLMETTTLVAFIGAGGVVGGAIVTLFGRFLFDRKKETTPPVVGFPPGEGNEQIAAYEIEEITFATTLEADGRTESVREYRGIRARAAGTVLQNQEVPYKVNASCGTFGQPVVKDVSGLPTELRITSQSAQLIEGSIMMLGLLRSDSRTDFDVSQPAEGMFLMTREAVLSAYKNAKWKTEYQSLTTAVPTKLLKITLRFPPSFKGMGKATSVVFGDQEEVDQGETNRVKNALVMVSSAVAVLTVEDPKIGLRYAISWMPPV